MAAAAFLALEGLWCSTMIHVSGCGKRVVSLNRCSQQHVQLAVYPCAVPGLEWKLLRPTAAQAAAPQHPARNEYIRRWSAVSQSGSCDSLRAAAFSHLLWAYLLLAVANGAPKSYPATVCHREWTAKLLSKSALLRLSMEGDRA